MKTKGVNRVIIAVRDLDKSVALYTKLLNCTFEDQHAAAVTLVKITK
jgi:catechol 2,3-dioxygenase-like lactoylglutathione lyase family enzyme